jgi:hypothetical protein
VKLHGYDLDFKEVYYEELYVGERADRLARLHELLEFLDLDQAIKGHGSVIEENLFDGGQNTVSVRQFVPNLEAVISALAAAGCQEAASLLK